MEIEKEIKGETDALTAEIGEDRPLMAAKPITVIRVEEQIVYDKNKKQIGTKINLYCTHPDVRERAIEISKVKYLSGNTLKISGLWINRDDEGKLIYRSALAHMLRYHNAKRTLDLIGHVLQTVEDEQGYLVIKAY